MFLLAIMIQLTKCAINLSAPTERLRPQKAKLAEFKRGAENLNFAQEIKLKRRKQDNFHRHQIFKK